MLDAYHSNASRIGWVRWVENMVEKVWVRESAEGDFPLRNDDQINLPPLVVPDLKSGASVRKG